MTKLIEQLHGIGLPKKQALVYCTLLQVGEKTITELAILCALSRPSIYKILRSLLEHGLVTNPLHNKASLFRASNPDAIFLLLRKRQQLFVHLLPSLRELPNVPHGTII